MILYKYMCADYYDNKYNGFYYDYVYGTNTKEKTHDLFKKYIDDTKEEDLNYNLFNRFINKYKLHINDMALIEKFLNKLPEINLPANSYKTLETIGIPLNLNKYINKIKELPIESLYIITKYSDNMEQLIDLIKVKSNDIYINIIKLGIEPHLLNNIISYIYMKHRMNFPENF